MNDQAISIQVLNEFFQNKPKYFIHQSDGHQGIPDSYGDGMQGEYNESFKFYQHPEFPENIFWKETYHTDSYNYNSSIVQFGFVQGVAKVITVYEPLS